MTRLLGAVVALGLCASPALAQSAGQTTRGTAAEAGGNPGTIGTAAPGTRSSVDAGKNADIRKPSNGNGGPDHAEAESGGR